MPHAPARSCPAILALGLSIASLALTSCSGGGGGGSSGGTSSSGSGTSTGSSAQSYVNPAWATPAQAPRAYWPSNPGPQPVLSGWFSNNPWLVDTSSWYSYMQNGHQPGRDMLGAYGIGNGRCFAMAGLSYPLNTLHGMIGPTYQANGGYFGDMSIGVEIYPRTIAFTDEWAMKPRRAGVVVTKAVASNIELYTVDMAPPGLDAIIRQVIVRNPTTSYMSDVAVTARLLGGDRVDGGMIRQERGNRRLAIGGAFGSAATTIVSGPAGNVMKLPMGPLLPGEEKVGLIFCAIGGDEPSVQATVAQCRSTPVQQWIDLTRDHWQQLFAQGSQLALPDAKVQDFVEDMICCCLVQTAENGCTSPMSRYTKTWMRDQEGALRLFLRAGRPEPIGHMLDSYYKTSIMEGGIYNSMVVDYDVSQAGTAPDWMTAGFMSGREPVEAPSYIPIEIWDYYQATGDLSILQRQYDYCKAAVLRQDRSPQNLMKFNGDEPFRWVMMVATGLYEPENRGWSSNSAFLFVAAAERMAKMAMVLGKTADAIQFQQMADDVRAATEQNFWLNAQGFYDVCKLFYGNIPVAQPFEDISLMPLRIGYGDAHHPNVRQNVLTVKSMRETTEGLIQSNALIGGGLAYDGMVPGYWLQNLTMIDHPDAERTFNTIEKVASVSGEIAEGQYAFSHGAVLIGYDVGGGADIVARYRPWEGGLVGESVLQYLFGEAWDAPSQRLTLTPHMPNGWGEMSQRGLKFMGQSYDVEVKDFGLRRLQRVTNRSSKPLTVDLGASVTGTVIGQVRVDGSVIQQPVIDQEFGRLSFRVQATIQAGQWVDLDFDYVP